MCASGVVSGRSARRLACRCRRGAGPHPRTAPGAGPGRCGRRRRGRAISCCSTPCCPSSTDGRCRRRRRWRSPAYAAGVRRTSRGGASSSRNPGAGATCATRSCTSSRPPTTPCGRSRRCGPASGTRSWWWVARVCGTATSTPTTSAPSIEAALDAGRPRDIRVTDLAEQVEEERWVSEGAGVPAADRRHRACRRVRPWWRWPTARASAGSSGPWACSTSWPAASP